MFVGKVEEHSVFTNNEYNDEYKNLFCNINTLSSFFFFSLFKNKKDNSAYYKKKITENSCNFLFKCLKRFNQQEPTTIKPTFRKIDLQIQSFLCSRQALKETCFLRFSIVKTKINKEMVHSKKIPIKILKVRKKRKISFQKNTKKTKNTQRKEKKEKRGKKEKKEKRGKKEKKEKRGKKDKEEKRGKKDKEEKRGKKDKEEKRGKKDKEEKRGKKDKEEKRGKKDKEEKEEEDTMYYLPSEARPLSLLIVLKKAQKTLEKRVPNTEVPFFDFIKHKKEMIVAFCYHFFFSRTLPVCFLPPSYSFFVLSFFLEQPFCFALNQFSCVTKQGREVQRKRLTKNVIKNLENTILNIESEKINIQSDRELRRREECIEEGVIFRRRKRPKTPIDCTQDIRVIEPTKHRLFFKCELLFEKQEKQNPFVFSSCVPSFTISPRSKMGLKNLLKKSVIDFKGKNYPFLTRKEKKKKNNKKKDEQKEKWRNLSNLSEIFTKINKVNSKNTIVRVLSDRSNWHVPNTPYALISYFSTDNGEIIEMQGKNGSLILRESDQKSYRIEDTTSFPYVGQLIRYGSTTLGFSQPGQVIQVEKNKVILRKAQPFLIPSRGVLNVKDGIFVEKNKPLCSLFYQRLMTEDIIQGIPKIEQLFEGRAFKEGRPIPNNLPVFLLNEFLQSIEEFHLEEAARISFYKVQHKLLTNIQRVYVSQGVIIPDKHLEVIIQQMTSKVKIVQGNLTSFLKNEVVDINRLEKHNKKIGGDGEQRDFTIYQPIVLGITRASLEAESFVSAASFQESTRVLSQTALRGRKDFMRGLKERVIIGDFISAGTGAGFSTDSKRLQRFQRDFIQDLQKKNNTIAHKTNVTQSTQSFKKKKVLKNRI